MSIKVLEGSVKNWEGEGEYEGKEKAITFLILTVVSSLGAERSCTAPSSTFFSLAPSSMEARRSKRVETRFETEVAVNSLSEGKAFTSSSSSWAGGGGGGGGGGGPK